MAKRKIGVFVDNLKLGVWDGVKKAKEIGADGCQLSVTSGELYPDNFSKEKRGELKKFVSGLGLEITALCGDFDWIKGFTDAEFNKINIPRIKKCIDLACDLDTKIVTMHIGKFPQDESRPVYQETFRTTVELGRYAEERDVILATETGPEDPKELRVFLDKVSCKGIGVNYDPANLVMCGPFDHIGGVEILKDYICHTHAKDGVCLGKGKYIELPLGEGGVVFKYYLKALDDIGYNGYLTVEREAGDNRIEDIKKAVEFLRTF
ncbi:MAG: sugar phosphate isomerase/epimerase family protein [bacterium]